MPMKKKKIVNKNKWKNSQIFREIGDDTEKHKLGNSTMPDLEVTIPELGFSQRHHQISESF